MSGDQADPIPETLKAHRALAVLQLMNGHLRGAGNERLIASLLDVVGIRVSRAEMRETLEFLEREGSIEAATAEGLMVVTLKHHGHEITSGLVTVEGIERPTPGLSY